MGGNGPTLGGYSIQARLGQSLRLSDSWSLGFQGVFSHSSFSRDADSLSRTSVGLELGPEVTLARNIFGLGLYGGFHQAWYYSQGIPWASPPGRATFDNTHVTALSLRPTLLFAGGLLGVSFQWDHDFGLTLPGPTPYDPLIPANPDRYSLFFSLDLLKAFYALRGSVDGPTESIEEYLSGIQFGALVESTYTYSFNQPAGSPGVNTYRINDPHHNRVRLNLMQVSLDRPATAASPFGFGFDFNFGEDPGSFAPKESINVPVAGARGDPGTQYFAIQRALLRYRMPILEGFTLEAGQFPAPVGFEGPTGNMNLSRGLVYGFLEPFYFGGGLLRMRFHENSAPVSPGSSETAVQNSTEAVIGVANDWDTILGHNGGATFFTGLTWMISPMATWAVNGMVNSNRGLFNTTLTIKPVSQLTLVGNADIGHGTDPASGATGTFGGAALYQQWQPFDWLYFATREEYVSDQGGVRTGLGQDLISLTGGATFLTPYGFGVGPEVRHDRSFNRSGTPGPFFSGANPADSNTTFGIRAFWRYPFPY